MTPGENEFATSALETLNLDWPENFSICILTDLNIKILYFRGVKLIFTGGHISLAVAFKGPDVILGLYTCNYSLIVKRELGAG